MNDANPLTLEFSQTSLQDFLDCPRRFELSVLQEMRWPAAHSAPLLKFEELTEIGSKFHHLCHQFFLGIDPDLLSSSLINPEISELWDSFLPYGKSLQHLPGYYEQILRIPFENHFLVAKFDLIVQQGDNDYLIIDWKTASKKPSKSILANRVQTFLYPYIFQGAGGELFGAEKISPTEITLQYWYPLAGIPEEVFPYSDATHQEVTQNISDLIQQIYELIDADKPFPLTNDRQHCKYCIYRSYCERGHLTSSVPAGTELEQEDLSNVHFDLDLIKEIEF